MSCKVVVVVDVVGVVVGDVVGAVDAAVGVVPWHRLNLFRAPGLLVPDRNGPHLEMLAVCVAVSSYPAIRHSNPVAAANHLAVSSGR